MLRKTDRKELIKIRNLEICKLVSEQLTYEKIGIIFNLTKERVRQIYNFSGFSKKTDNEDLYLNLYKKVSVDMKRGLSFDELMSKHELSNPSVREKLYKLGLTNIVDFYKEKRNKIIIEEYKSGKTAEGILLLENKYLLGGLNISTAGRIYGIISKNNQKRYPHIYNRRGGGCFEKEKIVNKIIKLKKKHNFLEIAKIFKSEKILTVSGKPFSYALIRYQYHKNKNKKNNFKTQ